ncbi:hypothetical protein [Streptomyces sp. NPDC090131]|uniref:hypothetical protein n=1 Tax=Streptomyces sp. NPDC090131 TaxID=3365954 RepID=UPI0037FA0AB6
MEWIGVVQQASSSPWLSAVLGGAGAAFGASLTSVASLRVLSDTKQARVRAEEREATGLITAAMTGVRNYAMDEGEPGRNWRVDVSGLLMGTEAAALVFRDARLRDRLTGSIGLIINAEDLRTPLAYTPEKLVAMTYIEMLKSLGTNLRGEQLQNPSKNWSDAIDCLLAQRHRFE